MVNTCYITAAKPKKVTGLLGVSWREPRALGLWSSALINAFTQFTFLLPNSSEADQELDLEEKRNGLERWLSS